MNIHERFTQAFPTLISQISIGVTLLGIIFGLLFMLVQIYENRKGYRTAEVLIGIAPFYIYQASSLEDEYIIKLKSSNNYLRDHHIPYRFAPYFSNKTTYPGIIKSLKNGEINMAFLSMGLYGAAKHGKLGVENFDKDYELIGFIRRNHNKVYYTGIVYKKDSSSFVYTTLRDPQKNIDTILNMVRRDIQTFHIPKKDSISLILGSDEYSVSSHILPETWLLSKKINVRDWYTNYRHHLPINRKEMLDSIKKNDCYIGFMSNEDFYRIEDIAHYEFYEITEIPIPYDAVIVNRKWWHRRGKKMQELLKKALDQDRLGLTLPREDNNIEERVNFFLDYIYGGMVTDTLLHVSIPNSAMDIHNFRRPDVFNVQLFNYIPSENNSNMQQFTANKIIIDSCKVKLILENDRKYRIKIADGASSAKKDSIIKKYIKTGFEVYFIPIGQNKSCKPEKCKK